MNLAEKFAIESINKHAEESEVKYEIISYFKDYIDSGDFERSLESRLTNEAKSKREMSLFVEFWNYVSGCSDTYFGVGSKRWENPNDSGYRGTSYKGVLLNSISVDVCEEVLKMTISALEKMGFRTRCEDVPSRLGRFNKKVYIMW